MSFNDFYKRFIAFGLAFALSLFAAAFFYGISYSNIFEKEFEPVVKTAVSKVSSTKSSFGGNGIGSSSGCLGPEAESFKNQTSKKSDAKPEKVEGVKILSKPRASYTDAALANGVQGKVVLRVTFSADGTVGAISVINDLPDGLTEAAMEAAKGIKFEPAKRGGAPYSVMKPVEYNFTIY